MTARSPGFWSLNTLLGAVLATIAAVAAGVIIADSSTVPNTSESQIIAATEGFFEAMASEDQPALESVVCAEEMETFTGFTGDPVAKRIVGVADIVISGDTATGTMVVEEPAKPELGSSLIPMSYADEDGWKLCPSTTEETP